MSIRTAEVKDIKQMQFVRNAVKENMLSDPALVPDSDVQDFITERGKGWVCEVDGTVVGFSIADLRQNNVWALFVLPEYEHRGIGSRLHEIMLNWYFSETGNTLWLGTAPGTRAETFYRKKGWIETGLHGREIRFEMPRSKWRLLNTPA